MGLEGMADIGDITRLAPNPGQIKNMLVVVERRLDDARSESIHPETRLEQAYEVVFKCATAALRAEGFRARSGEGKHSITIETLRNTIFKDEDD